MIDSELLSTISRLTGQRQALRVSHAGVPLTADKTEQLRAMDAALEEAWGQLRQHRAWRRAGSKPEGAPISEATTTRKRNPPKLKES